MLAGIPIVSYLMPTGPCSKNAGRSERSDNADGENKEPSSKTRHRSIVVYLNDYHTSNKCILNACYINYLHYSTERFVPQFEITQCFNCCEYGHRAANCKRNSRCGKCARKHNTKECNSTTVQYIHCKGPHEAWRHECPA